MMETLKIFWFFLWRTSFLSLLLAALVGAAYGVSILVGGAVFSDGSAEFNLGATIAYMLGMGIIFGVLGLVGGLAFGFLNGLSLFAITRAFYYPRPVNGYSYRNVAGWACAVPSVLVLMLDWLLHGFPDPDEFILRRIFGDDSLYEASAGPLIVLVVVPILLLASSLWFSGRKVADWHLKRHGDAGRDG